MLALLDWHGVELDEIIVPYGLLERLDTSALTLADIQITEAAEPVRPQRLWDYIYLGRGGSRNSDNPWHSGDRPRIPFALITASLVDLVRVFQKDPDATLTQAHRRLETRVRARLGEQQNSDLAGVNLYRRAFVGPNRRLHRPGASASEQEGRANLFTGSVMAYRNRRVHVEGSEDWSAQLTEFLLLNELFLFESEAVETSAKPAAGSGES